MLVLSRRAGESVMIGDDITLTVLEVKGDVVRIGVQAPRSIRVFREELYRELRRTNADAASPADSAVDALTALLHAGHPTGPAGTSHPAGPAGTSNPAGPAGAPDGTRGSGGPPGGTG